MAADLTKRAISALSDYWSEVGRVPAPSTVARIRAAIEDRLASGGYGTHWQSLLDDALADLDYSAEWAGQRIRSLTLWGSPPGAESQPHQTVPLGYLDAQAAVMDDENARSA
ncbi:hypothetical protein [Methylobacterium oxalidis]|uniref:hypothetical protein n=1 Tax=Methylobacterium oxalidis TaxID=944322 RepID=UPI0033161D85